MTDEKDKNSKADDDASATNNTEDYTPLHRNMPNPRELMRIRHPDLFSDTRIDGIPRLPREVFEYHLDTLTSRKQEYEFEHFCRKLAERELCPNLRIQTGPTGGGDSKVDTETYPVADEIAERWWIGSPAAGSEWWAFAFSAKKDWRAKIRSDVTNISSTNRDYKLIYFFSNQFISDKNRATYEDALTKNAKIPVHIIDRAWITEKVYNAHSDHLEVYLSALGVEHTQQDKVIRPGPRDTARLTELEELDKQITDPSRYQGAQYQLVEDCLRSAILARSLERPRGEVESRLARAARLAQNVNYDQQRLRIAYNQAWTAFWWYQDYGDFSHLYDEVEELSRDSSQAHDAGLLVNLWLLLMPSIAEGRINRTIAKLETRTLHLNSMLQNLVDDSTRPNNALEARTQQILMRAVQAYHLHRFDDADVAWRDMCDVVDTSTGLGAYSVEHLYGLVREVGEFIESPNFDALYEKLTISIQKRRSDGEAGEAYSHRAFQKLKQERPYEAIRWFGQAEELLVKEEYRAELTAALIGSSYAYQRVGLRWAARNKAIAAVLSNLAVFTEKGDIIPQVLLAVRRLVWTELLLGRIPHALHAITLSDNIASNLNFTEERLSAYTAERWEQEIVLGIHFLNVPLDKLVEVTHLPTTLERLGLERARMALLWALGHEQELREHGYIPATEDADAVQTLFEHWGDQPIAEDMAASPLLMEGTASVLTSTILGSELAIETPNNLVSLGLAESILGALEAFLSTSDEEDVFPHRERMTIVITPSTQLTGTPQVRFPEDDGNRVEIVHPADFRTATLTEHQAYMKWLQENIMEIACRILAIPDPKAWVDKVAGQERGLSRALTLGDALIMDSNLFGSTPQILLTDWLEKEGEGYPLLRDDPWRKARTDPNLQSSKFGVHPPPLIDKQQLKHTDRQVRSPIDIPVWDRAKWRGIVVMCFEDGPPVLALAFEDRDAGRSIFRTWKDRWGDVDKNDALRLTIVTGVSKKNPAAYSVLVGPSLQHLPEDEKKLVTFVSRFQRMSPNTSTNLDNFLKSYRNTGVFFLAPAWMSKDGQLLGEPSFELSILKRDIFIRQAWNIGENDPDISCLNETDEPIVPANVIDPPFIKALRKKRGLGRRRRRDGS